MARAKRKSDETYNARRRAKRAAARIQRDMQGMSRSERAAAQSYLDTLNERINATYASKTGTRQQRAQSVERASQAAQQLDRATKGVRAQRSATARTNKLFEQQVNRARLGEPSTLGRYGAAEVDVFYAATRRIWQGKPAKDRNKLIMESLGTSSLREAFTSVLSQNMEALRVYRNAIRSSRVPDTTDPAFAGESGADGERMGSPIWESYLSLVG